MPKPSLTKAGTLLALSKIDSAILSDALTRYRKEILADSSSDPLEAEFFRLLLERIEAILEDLN